MNAERIISAIDAFAIATTPETAVAALGVLMNVRAELMGELQAMKANGAETLPEGFVEFAMNVMKSAKELRAAGHVPFTVAYSSRNGKAYWFSVHDEIDVQDLVTVAANALLLAVEPVVAAEDRAN